MPSAPDVFFREGVRPMDAVIVERRLEGTEPSFAFVPPAESLMVPVVCDTLEDAWRFADQSTPPGSRTWLLGSGGLTVLETREWAV